MKMYGQQRAIHFEMDTGQSYPHRLHSALLLWCAGPCLAAFTAQSCNVY